jgi:hypothetical protein
MLVAFKFLLGDSREISQGFFLLCRSLFAIQSKLQNQIKNLTKRAEKQKQRSNQLS